ncbi:hypothetical protein EJ377_00735 [Chryseobacterium arthrosphaerae]|uniref:Uncharacterized protein n=1 Tax=Chryseobacterium arthrosphaerae TaxID=651561 RepID=A0A432DY60_9FLAO|nr:hypothetical protein EJ377_00735 [Chryseobacterium arthrosphaerae]
MVTNNTISQYVPEKGLVIILMIRMRKLWIKHPLLFEIKGTNSIFTALKSKKARQQKQLETQPESAKPSSEKPEERQVEKR